MKLWKKWDDYVKIKLHLNGNIEWHCMQLEFKFNANQFKFNWRETRCKIDAQGIENMIITFIICDYGVENKPISRKPPFHSI